MPKSDDRPKSDAIHVDDHIGHRKPKAKRRESGLTFWFTEEEKALLMEAADGLPVSPWGRQQLLKLARAAIRKAGKQ